MYKDDRELYILKKLKTERDRERNRRMRPPRGKRSEKRDDKDQNQCPSKAPPLFPFLLTPRPQPPLPPLHCAYTHPPLEVLPHCQRDHGLLPPNGFYFSTILSPYYHTRSRTGHQHNRVAKIKPACDSQNVPSNR